MPALKSVIGQGERLEWVESGSSIYAHERPLPQINLTFTWRRPTTGHLVADCGQNLWRDGIGNGWRDWIGVTRAFGPE